MTGELILSISVGVVPVIAGLWVFYCVKKDYSDKHN